MNLPADPAKEQALLAGLRAAEQLADATAIESAMTELALYHSVIGQFLAAVPFGEEERNSIKDSVAAGRGRRNRGLRSD